MQRNTNHLNRTWVNRLLISATVAVFATLAACGPKVDLPPLAEVDTSELLTDVATQLNVTREKVDKSPKDATANGRYGLVLATYGRDEAADIAFERARLLAPKEARWAFYHSFVLRRLGATEQALAVADAGLAVSPDQIDLVVKRGELLFDLARFDEAEVMLDKALAEGAKLIQQPRTEPWGQTTAYVADLNGFLIEICTPIAPAP